MNAAKTKLLTWTVAGALGVALCLYVILSLQRLDRVRGHVSTERMTKVLSDTPAIVAQADNIVPYDQVNAALIDFDWPGKPPPVVVEAAPVKEEPKSNEKSIGELVQILGYKADATQPERSSAVIKYLPPSRVPPPVRLNPNHEGVQKYPGARLDDPLGHVRIVSIGVRGVEFAFDDEEREHEFLKPNEFDLEGRIVRVDPDGVIIAPAAVPIVKGNWQGNPAQTVHIGRNRFRLGTEDVETFGQDYPRILSEEVRLGRHKDPKTGRYDGIEIHSVAPGSVPARHGAQSGDVIKSINGQAVTSTQEAINFVKNNSEMYERWDVVVENMGRERTVTYYPPSE